MKKLLISYFLQERGKWEKVFLIMRLSILFTFAAIINVTASGYSQTVKIDLELKNATLQQVFQSIQEQTEFDFFYKNEHLPHNKVINRSYKNIRVDEILDEVLEGTGLIYRVMNTDIVITKGPAGASDSHRLTSSESNQQSRMVTGKITDPGGQPLPGVTIVVKGTTQGTITNTDGEYTITNIPEDATLVFSFVGMRTQEVVVGSQVNINVVMEEDVIGLDEVIAIGYGTMKKSDLTGSVVRVDQEIITERPNISVMQSLQGSSPGLNVGQVNAAGEEPSISIRGRNSISGAQAPLIVLDGV
ncbi:MAG: carboxypeptidase-like regulatory domain-containing protein, partial [Prolixibacteraceae bacterium]|nr:carboxypeptidase-like regulatory domain-containing protein [Prolixibacteraceae bacterium]